VLTSRITTAGAATSPALRTRFLWPFPEWWALTLSALGWVYLVTAESRHASRHFASAPPVAHTTAGIDVWMAMVAAMMIPLVIGPIRVTAARSLWRRRHRAVAGFLVGYLSMWMLAGVAMSQLGGMLPFDANLVAAGGFVIAAGWNGTAIRRRALAVCHRTTPLAPSGWRADVDCLRYGCIIGRHCVASCWALMLACVLTGHAMIVMVGAGVIMIVERYSYAPRVQITSRVLAGVALVYAAAALR
jgi:predicted metal-binding membrane protein